MDPASHNLGSARAAHLRARPLSGRDGDACIASSPTLQVFLRPSTTLLWFSGYVLLTVVSAESERIPHMAYLPHLGRQVGMRTWGTTPSTVESESPPGRSVPPGATFVLTIGRSRDRRVRTLQATADNIGAISRFSSESEHNRCVELCRKNMPIRGCVPFLCCVTLALEEPQSM
jgi:hypothetical protein